MKEFVISDAQAETAVLVGLITQTQPLFHSFKPKIPARTFLPRRKNGLISLG